SRFFILTIPIAALLIGSVSLKWWPALVGVASIIIAATTIFMLDGRIKNVAQPGILAAEDLRALTPLEDQKLPESTPLLLVGDAKAFVYQFPMTRLHYRTVFDVDVQSGET